jgi:hypothetical protein
MAMDRVALVALCWFVVLTGGGAAMGTLFAIPIPGTGAIVGFLLALFGLFAWPWIMPEAVSRWMNRDWTDDLPMSRRHR